MSDIIVIRNETPADYKTVEEITRRAFYNLYVPGCSEHYLVHIMRDHKDFLSGLDFVIEVDGQVIGNIMYTRAKLIDEEKREKEILTFGPICIEPSLQRRGYGKMLMEHSFQRGREMGYEAIVIFGDPSNYVSSGFQSCKKQNVSLENGVFPAAMLVKELLPATLAGKKWVYQQSTVMNVDEEAARRFDDGLEKLEKKYQPCQEVFYILSHASL